MIIILKRLLVIIVLLLAAAPILAQESTPEAPSDVSFIGEATVDVESAFVRLHPSTAAEAVASVFERDPLEVVGRNIDGLWFEVRRPGRMFHLGWIAIELLDYGFEPERLPITDSETGLVGDIPVEDTGIAVYLVQEANLREGPFVSTPVITVAPLEATLPVIGRDSNGSWARVNYRGTVGWVSSATFRRPANLLDAPVYIPPGVQTLSAEVIPPEIQLGQLERFRAFAGSSKAVVSQLVPFWELVQNGEVMPCEPPPFVQEYLITRGDVRELPELNRYVPRFNEGVQLLNESIDPLYVCGVLQPDVVREARNDAVNANIIFGATLDQLDNLEHLIRQQNNLEEE